MDDETRNELRQMRRDILRLEAWVTTFHQASGQHFELMYEKYRENLNETLIRLENADPAVAAMISQDMEREDALRRGERPPSS
jgi:hypothetical protein